MYLEQNVFGVPSGVGRLQQPAARKQTKQRLPNPFSGETTIGDFLLVPLLSKKRIREEESSYGIHLSEYIEKCQYGTMALFSICTRSGQRVAILALTLSDDCWEIDFCYGPFYAEVMDEMIDYIDEEGGLQTEWLPTEIYYIAHEVTRLAGKEFSH